MKKIILLGYSLILFQFVANAQNYVSYFTGDSIDKVVNGNGGICMMGGATENDEAMKWFLQKCNGGDVLVLRASGSNGYNAYLYSSLGITVNSVESIVCNNAASANESYIQQKISQAEGIWFAGGDQWSYISYWRNTKIDSLINQAITMRNIVIGGTSAGMAILGKYYFSAQNGTVTSPIAMSNPYDALVTVDSTRFLKNTILKDVITDTHYDNPDRRGRQVTFLARILKDFNKVGKGIACDEYTSVCIEPSGLAKVYGNFPTDDDNAYFIQSNCEIISNMPETCTNSNPLTWNQGGKALKVYRIKGTQTGSNTFDLNDWKTGVGGTWEDWSVTNGTLNTVNATAINCIPSAIHSSEIGNQSIQVFPNPSTDLFNIESNQQIISFQLYDRVGRNINGIEMQHNKINLAHLPCGIYFLKINTPQGISYAKLMKE